MDELKASLQVTLANAFFMAFKAHSYHWNVKGLQFSQYHDFFGEIYEDVDGSVDVFAERLRTIGQAAPVSVEELHGYKTFDEDTEVLDLVGMLTSLQEANNQVIDSLNNLFKKASAANEQGIADIAAGRIDAHKKHGWMIKSSLGE